ncbi:MAG TPA: hypothetical protein VE911_05195 [Candidatus Nitrosopolaris sp.]|nr:hypothetical protein [Candidatus Nitrosopolaris sp.]
MATQKRIEHATATLSFSSFWTWLQAHPNCILRAGTPEMVVYDADDLHWHFASEGDDTVIVQVIRGKNLASEMVVAPNDITYVQGVAGEVEDEFVFELITETDRDRIAAYHFVLSHGYDAQDAGPSRRAVH